MSHQLVSYTLPAALQSNLLRTSPDGVPSVEELEDVSRELNNLKQKSFERAKKAENDLRAIEVAFKKMRELEKGKAKAFAKVKREPSYTPSLDAEDREFSTIPNASSSVAGSSNLFANSGINSSVARGSVEARKVKKKDRDRKRKRDADESDAEHDVQRPRKFSPHPPSGHKEPHTYKASKLSNVSNAKTTSSADFWNLPQSNSLLPIRPPIPPPPQAGPRRPIDVTEDFTKAKSTPSQVPVTTFYTSIEPWLRPIREEDVGWLEYSADEVEPYVMPNLGRHYTEAWEDEDQEIYGGIPALLDFSQSRAAAGSHASGVLPKWDSLTIGNDDLATEKGMGPVTERLVSALLPAPDPSTWKKVKDSEDAYEKAAASNPSVNGHPPVKEKVFVADFEERVKDTARFYGLLDRNPDFSETVDDPISTALRQAQRQLRIVVATNKKRKARLADLARDRLAYQEYVEQRDNLDKSITAAYSKLQKKDGPKVNKKKKKADVNGVNGVNGIPGQPQVPLPNPASSGLNIEEDGTLSVPEALKTLIDVRKQWVNIIGGAFDEKEKEAPGRIRGLPPSSVFEGIDEEVRKELGMGNKDVNGKDTSNNRQSVTRTDGSSEY